MKATPFQLAIRTPEGVTFSLLLAGPLTRFLAWVLDFFCVQLIMMALRIIFTITSLINEDTAAALHILFYFVISIGYAIALEWAWRGQTVGKRLLRLRVVDADGLRLRFSQIVLRNLLRLVDNLPAFYLLGGVAMLISPRAQRLGDFAAGTVVVRYPLLREPALDKISAGKFNSFRSYPHLAARLRQSITPAEGAILVRALVRREALEPTARLDLYRELADHCRKKVPFPQEAVDGLSDEHYLKNVVDIVYRMQRAENKP